MEHVLEVWACLQVAVLTFKRLENFQLGNTYGNRQKDSQSTAAHYLFLAKVVALHSPAACHSGEELRPNEPNVTHPRLQKHIYKNYRETLVYDDDDADDDADDDIGDDGYDDEDPVGMMIRWSPPPKYEGHIHLPFQSEGEAHPALAGGMAIIPVDGKLWAVPHQRLVPHLG